MSNFPRFGRARQRPSVAAPPVPAAVQPSVAEPQPVIILPFAPDSLTLQPVEPNPPAPPSPPRESPRRVLSPAKKATSPSASPKYGEFVAPTMVHLPEHTKLNRSPPPSSGFKLSEGRNGETTPPRSPAKSLRATMPPLSPLALPRTQLSSVNETAAQVQPRIQPEVEQKTIVYNKTVDKPATSDRPSEYSSGKPHQKQKPAEVITLSGHNIGAVMEINKSSAGHRLGGETIKKNDTEGGDGGGVRHGNEEKKKGAKKKKEAPMTAFMNSNFQSVNNSVLYESSCNHHDPGLHLAFSDAAEGDGATVDGHRDHKSQ